MGYGFVEVEENDLPEALEKLNKSQLGNRTINLEKATSTNSNKQTKKPRKPRTKTRKSGAAGAKPDGDKLVSDDKPARPAGTRTTRPPRPAGEKRTPAADKPAGEKSASGEPQKKRINRKKKTVAKPTEGEPTVVENGSGAPAVPAAKKTRAPRKPKPVNTNVKREHSNNELYVANIPFTLTDEELKEAFSAFGCESAIVIINTYGKNKGKSNRGYGFVKVDTEENQKAAISQDKVLKIGGRDISIKPAFIRSEPVKPADAQEPSSEAPKAEAPKSEEETQAN